MAMLRKLNMLWKMSIININAVEIEHLILKKKCYISTVLI